MVRWPDKRHLNRFIVITLYQQPSGLIQTYITFIVFICSWQLWQRHMNELRLIGSHHWQVVDQGNFTTPEHGDLFTRQMVSYSAAWYHCSLLFRCFPDPHCSSFFGVFYRKIVIQGTGDGTAVEIISQLRTLFFVNMEFILRKLTVILQFGVQQHRQYHPLPPVWRIPVRFDNQIEVILCCVLMFYRVLKIIHLNYIGTKSM